MKQDLCCSNHVCLQHCLDILGVVGVGGRSVNVESNRIKLQATLISNIAYSCFALEGTVPHMDSRDYTCK